MNIFTQVAIGIVIASVASMAGYGKGYVAGKANIQQKWDKEKAVQMAEYAAAQQAAREKEQKLQANADNLRKEKDREIRDLNARSIALSNSLRDRQSRSEAGAMSKTAGTGVSQEWCTGARLYREHAEAFAGESAIAAEIQSELKSCIKQYEVVRKTLNNQQSSK
jgi:hypothetical protein